MDDLSHFVQRSQISNAAQIIANENGFAIESYRFHAQTSDDSKMVKIGSIQLSVNASATASVDEVRENVFGKVEKMVENVNILCLPEMWCESSQGSIFYECIPRPTAVTSDAYIEATLHTTHLTFDNNLDMPYPFYTPSDVAWNDFAEDAESGASVYLIKKLAANFKMIIVSSILEKESDMFFNTTLIISTTGNVIGKYRKIHIPPIEQPFLQRGAFEHSVVDTEVGKIGILICYERHFPLCWMMHGLQQVDIVFNPSAEDTNSMSERLWFAEGVNAAVSNGFFTVMVNRTGTETFGDGSSFSYFGSNYVASPYGYATPQLSRKKEGLLITEIDLNDCRTVKKEFSIHQNGHLDLYINKLSQMRLN